jgi:hypothetical protein
MAQLALLCGSANALKLVERSVLPNLLVLSILCGRSGPVRRTNHMYDRIRGCTEMLLTFVRIGVRCCCCCSNLCLDSATALIMKDGVYICCFCCCVCFFPCI